MKNYTITVNGNVYDVTVEEKGAGAAPVAPTPAAAPKAAPKAAPAPAPKAAGTGSIQKTGSSPSGSKYCPPERKLCKRNSGTSEP